MRKRERERRERERERRERETYFASRNSNPTEMGN